MSQDSGTTSSGLKRRTACAVCGDEFDGDQDKCPFDGTKLTVIAQELSPGTVLGGRFEVVSSVAGGGMGTVYKATHRLMKRSVAIKTLHPSLVASGAALKRFQQESQALSALNHPNILSVYDFFINDEGQPYLVMDYLEGTNLDTIREQNGPMPWQRALGIFGQACSGLAHAHSHGIIHRDIKPSNIMLVKNDKNKDAVKIVDFGIAKVRTDEDSTANLTSTGDVFGSPQYMSPEQCRGLTLDARSDIYSLGCVMYSTLTGKPAFGGFDNMECMYKQVHEALPPFDPELGVPPEVEEIVRKAMAKNPDDRFQTMEQLQAELDHVTPTPQPAVSKDATIPPPAPTPKPAPLPPAPPVVAAPAEPDSAKALPIKAIAIGIVVVAVGAFALGKVGDHKQPAATAPIGATTTPDETPDEAGVTTVAPVSTPVSTPPVQTPQLQLTPVQLYTQNLAAGQAAFKQQDYLTAQKLFGAARNAAWNFGQQDERFLTAMEWQAKVAKQLGQYAIAKQANDYIAAVRKRMKKHR